jgi:NADH dehydrogenase/NADH:ubiquinone oxidoreductase subunit G
MKLLFALKCETIQAGALTIKGYAFKARPWELAHHNAIDLFDATGTPIQISTIGLTLQRILPRIDKNNNPEWITDKVRFSFDAFVTQRLFTPVQKKN